MKPKKALVVHIEIASQPKEHYLTVKTVKDTLKEHSCRYKLVPRSRFSKQMLRGVDLLITVGGDGTYLTVAQLNTKGIPQLGVNSNPKTKVGFLCNSDRFDFAKKMERIYKGNMRIVELTRLDCKIGNRMIEPALNEIFFGHAKPYKLSRYTLGVNKNPENQRSSGIIVGTATGSNAWLRSAGAKMMKRESTQLQLFVREPHYGVFIKPTLVKKMLKSKDKVLIQSKEKEQIVVADSVGRVYNVRYGEKITIKRSAHSLKAIFFNKR